MHNKHLQTKKWIGIATLMLLILMGPQSQAREIMIGTLNCEWFFGTKPVPSDVEHLSHAQYELKAGHLIGLLPATPPLVLAVQEIGNRNDVKTLAQAADKRYHKHYQAEFVHGYDTYTGQNVGMLFDPNEGWGIYGKASRQRLLQYQVAKHLALVITNQSGIKLILCTVHLRRPIGEAGKIKQEKQVHALVRWGARFLHRNPDENVVILGDFNEAGTPNSAQQAIYPLLSEGFPHFYDLFGFSKSQNIKTQRHGAYDRILMSPALIGGESGLKITGMYIGKHNHTRDETYTDHYPVCAYFNIGRTTKN